ncbi:XRE family transcriptional regulator [Bacteroidales bacterium OttesenSCG-928-B11]|nr:XRE family transcriptional regulator [Bacteroidales bacterium OttesenSCG-928-C03]MDL2311775.1 XRE family transcriptional regulator [Bacteroidales bacterium OttesenSCG-928-B11]
MRTKKTGINIGELILEKLKEKERSITWLAKKIDCDDSNLGKILRNSRYIHVDLLFAISIALEEDFFVYYSQKIKENRSR